MSLELTTLLRVARELQRATTISELVSATRDAVLRAARYGNVWLAALEPGRPRMIRMMAISGDAEPRLWERAPLFPVEGDAMLEEILQGDSPVVVVDARVDPRTDKAMVEKLGNRTIINVPLVIGAEHLGALGAGSFAPEEPRTPTPDEMEALVVIAGLLAAALQRVKMLDEARALQRRLQAAQRMESLSVLAGGIAHDFNNLLTVIVSSASFVRDEPLSLRQRADLDAAIAAAQRASELTKQLLAMGRKQPLRLGPRNVGENLLAIEKLVHRLFPENITVELELPRALPPVRCDSQQVDQVLMNLCVNARDAMPNGGRLSLRAEETHWAEDAVASKPGAKAGDFVCLSVSDTGTGMAPEVLEHVLEPFFTTKAPGVGSGLGLAVVAGIVEQHQGILELASAPGAGTTFRVHLPVQIDAHTGPERSDTPEPAVPAVRATAVRLLLAEDELAVRSVTQRVLEGAGYQVTVVADGLAAVEKASSFPFDLVILDAVMPRASGREAWTRIRTSRPQTRFLLISGHSAEVFPSDLLENPGLVLLPKPFTPAELLRAVRDALAPG